MNISEEIQKATSFICTAKRLFSKGEIVELAALENKIRNLCEAVVELDREEARNFLPDLENLLLDLDNFERELTQRQGLFAGNVAKAYTPPGK